MEKETETLSEKISKHKLRDSYIFVEDVKEAIKEIFKDLQQMDDKSHCMCVFCVCDQIRNRLGKELC